VSRSTPIPIAARKLERHHVHRLVVVADDDDSLPIGILSATDLVRAIAAAGPGRDTDAPA
jgi:CBS domain-containing protein